MSTPVLWSWNLSPFAGKVRVAFAEKGVEVELIEIDPVQRPARLAELNPTNRVPVLEVDGVGIRESSAICDWLEETHPEPALWPADPARRASARGLMRWVDDELTVNFFGSIRKESFGPERSDHPEIITIMQRRFVKRWPVLEAMLERSGSDWLAGGEEPTYADLAAAPLAVRLPSWKPEMQPDADACPRASAWLEALRSRPSAAAVKQKGKPLEG
jgi:glutathione S-transferase